MSNPPPPPPYCQGTLFLDIIDLAPYDIFRRPARLPAMLSSSWRSLRPAPSPRPTSFLSLSTLTKEFPCKSCPHQSQAPPHPPPLSEPILPRFKKLQGVCMLTLLFLSSLCFRNNLDRTRYALMINFSDVCYLCTLGSPPLRETFFHSLLSFRERCLKTC